MVLDVEPFASRMQPRQDAIDHALTLLAIRLAIALTAPAIFVGHSRQPFRSPLGKQLLFFGRELGPDLQTSSLHPVG
jgi:hypothetical protein